MAGSYSFGSFRLDVTSELLFRGAEPQPLGRRAVAVLRALVERAGEPVSKDALIEAAWPGLAVEDANLTVQIAALRRVLAAEPGGERWIETLPRRGYRFVGPISTPAPRQAAEASVPEKPSIAVLPFAEYGAEDGFIGQGVAEDLVRILASLPDLFVISHNSTMKYRGASPDFRAIGRELGVRYLFFGTVRHAGDRLRIPAELIDAGTLVVITAHQVEAEKNNVFALYDQLLERVLQSIAPHIQQAELRRVRGKRPENLGAYEWMLRGLDLLYRLNQKEFKQAKEMFQRAIELDEHYAAPYAWSAVWHSLHVQQGWSSDRKADSAKIEEFCAAALRCDPNDVRALALSGHLRALNLRDYDGGLELVERALRVSPNSSMAWARSAAVCSYIGNGVEARHRCEQALRLSPFDPQIFWTHCQLAVAAYTMGDYDTAIAWGNRAYAENPNFTATLRFLAASLAAVGRIEEARRMAERLMQLEPRFRARQFSQGYAYQDGALRTQFGRHLMSAGLPE